MTDRLEKPIHLDFYFKRIGYSGDISTTLDTLQSLHLAHATHIPFENLEILLGRPIRLDSASLQEKLVNDRRGGYCFEQNLLFARVLEQLGFQVTRLAARVRYGTKRLLPRTHMLLRVEVDGEPYLADVGFGGEGLLLPIPMRPGKAIEQFAWRFRLCHEAGIWLLQTGGLEDWRDLYAFTLEPQEVVDYEVANYYVSTHPDSRFTRTLTVQLPTRDCRYMIRNREFSVAGHETTESRVLKSDDELLDVLGERFGLSFPSGTRFRFKE